MERRWGSVESCVHDGWVLREGGKRRERDSESAEYKDRGLHDVFHSWSADCD